MTEAEQIQPLVDRLNRWWPTMVAACPECGALVSDDTREQHRRWHIDTVTAVLILMNRVSAIMPTDSSTPSSREGQ